MLEPIKPMGRRVIYTDELDINEFNIIEILQRAMVVHTMNFSEIEYLLNFEFGLQPRKQEKVTRKEIDCITVDNVAHEISLFWRSYFWGQPFTLTQRGRRDSGDTDEGEAIALLNECYDAEAVNAKTQKIARFVEPCGVGYVYIDVKSDRVDGDSYFSYDVLDPRFTFIIYSGYYTDRRPMVGVTYRIDDNGSQHFTAITKNRRFEIDNLIVITNGKKDEVWDVKSGDINPFGIINIVEYFRSHDRTGVFEHEIDDMLDLNLNESNLSNSVAEKVNAIWLATDLDLKEEYTDENGNTKERDAVPKNNEWIFGFTSKDGATPKVTPLTVPLESQGVMNYIISKRGMILQKCNVPQRNDNSGGSTGIAMDTASGWTAADMVASMQQQIVEGCKQQELKVVLAVLAKSDCPEDSPMRKLKYRDIVPNMKRAKNYELTSKLNAFATGVSHGIDPAHMIREINFFSDPQQVIEDSREYMERYLDSVYKTGDEGVSESPVTENPNDTEGRNATDERDEITESPYVQ